MMCVCVFVTHTYILLFQVSNDPVLAGNMQPSLRHKKHNSPSEDTVFIKK